MVACLILQGLEFRVGSGNHDQMLALKSRKTKKSPFVI